MVPGAVLRIPEAEQKLFVAPGRNHRHLTIVETIDTSNGAPRVTGWRLWCMNCGVVGTTVIGDQEHAKMLSDQLRSDADPQCANRNQPVR